MSIHQKKKKKKLSLTHMPRTWVQFVLATFRKPLRPDRPCLRSSSTNSSIQIASIVESLAVTMVRDPLAASSTADSESVNTDLLEFTLSISLQILFLGFDGLECGIEWFAIFILWNWEICVEIVDQDGKSYLKIFILSKPSNPFWCLWRFLQPQTCSVSCKI